MDKKELVTKVMSKVAGWLDEYMNLLNYWTEGTITRGKGEADLRHVRSPYGYNCFYIGNQEIYLIEDDERNILNLMSGKFTYEILGVEPQAKACYSHGLTQGFGGRIIIYTAEMKKKV